MAGLPRVFPGADLDAVANLSGDLLTIAQLRGVRPTTPEPQTTGMTVVPRNSGSSWYQVQAKGLFSGSVRHSA